MSLDYPPILVFAACYDTYDRSPRVAVIAFSPRSARRHPFDSRKRLLVLLESLCFAVQYNIDIADRIHRRI